ncbi:MAG: hypothetical protein JST26_04535 [Bacteroidetes bacterium]|nr:hypothetical protein [Bacteroidota bacterium]
MGFRTETILIKPAFDISNADLLKQLGITEFESSGQIPFEDADSETGKSGVYIGKFNNCTILIGLDFTDDFLETEPKGIEKKIFDLQPDSEVLAIVNNEFDNSYIYSYSVNGIKKRLKAGNAENLWLDYGDILEEEKANYKNLKPDENNNQVYEWIVFKRNGEIHSVNEATHDQVGGEMGFRLCKKLTGVWYFDIENLELEHFQVQNSTTSATRTGTEKKWWTHR